jgi:predicted transcriptional regulator
MSSVMTVRVDEDLLAQIKAAARKEDRSVSAYVLRVLEEHLRQQAALSAPPARCAKSAMGALRDLGAPATIEEFRSVRRAASRSTGRRLDRIAEIASRK